MNTSRPLSRVELDVYLALIETSSLLRHAVEQQLRSAGDLSYVQFQLLARLGDAPSGKRRMTELADGVVYSRSGLTYQAQTLEQRGLVERTPADDDDRGVTVTITNKGRGVLTQVFPGHIEILQGSLFAALSPEGTDCLAEILGRVRDHMRAAPPRSSVRRRTPRQ